MVSESLLKSDGSLRDPKDVARIQEYITEAISLDQLIIAYEKSSRLQGTEILSGIYCFPYLQSISEGEFGEVQAYKSITIDDLRTAPTDLKFEYIVYKPTILKDKPVGSIKHELIYERGNKLDELDGLIQKLNEKRPEGGFHVAVRIPDEIMKKTREAILNAKLKEVGNVIENFKKYTPADLYAS